jgi:hypothetical protein
VLCNVRDLVYDDEEEEEVVVVEDMVCLVPMLV